MSQKIIKIHCAICESHFYIDDSKEIWGCAICGDRDNFYAKKIFIAKSIGEEID